MTPDVETELARARLRAPSANHDAAMHGLFERARTRQRRRPIAMAIGLAAAACAVLIFSRGGEPVPPETPVVTTTVISHYWLDDDGRVGDFVNATPVATGPPALETFAYAVEYAPRTDPSLTGGNGT